MAYKSNLKDTEQTECEVAQFEGGVPVFTAPSTTRVIPGGNYGAPEKKVGGTVVNHNEKRLDDLNIQPGK